MTYHKTIWTALVLSFCCMYSCMSNHETVVVSVNPERWHRPAVLVYPNTDTLTLREAAFVLRYGPEVEPLNGKYIIEAQSPSGARTRDTLDITVTPRASGSGLREMRVPYRTGVRLAGEGDYNFTVTPPPGTGGIWSVAIDFRKRQ